eukprot:Plantae.Rhodophyta-Palmaria_palmata.ctg7899.p1 GENE.Plantae.Rhodophyta-Palmaria_palmata.ctg7899~~Plantae.Rhodophyta-Palmaria_palmata.ctg7899.p1  ORF type:complete len:145 (-),score=4.69 Plantae.Rhodophyta-Palmaria_palmata.ctg7899:453-863(-)
MEDEMVVNERGDISPVQRSDCVGCVGIPVPVHQYERNKLDLVGRVGSEVWLHVMRLAGDHEECAKLVSDKSKRSHVCTYSHKGSVCWRLLKCQRNRSNGFNTNEALDHFRFTTRNQTLGKSRCKKSSVRFRLLATR